MSSDSSLMVTLERNGARHEVELSQVNTENLRRMFHVSISEVWLKDDITGKAYFPGEDGSFHLADIAEYITLTVEGPDLSQSTSLPRRANPFQRSSLYSASSSTVSSTPSGTSPATPIFRSVVAPRKGSTFCVKIVKAKVKKGGNRKKPEFLPISQAYIELTESTANLDHISSMVKRRWGDQYVIVTSDGIQLEDSPATQGLRLFIHVLSESFLCVASLYCSNNGTRSNFI